MISALSELQSVVRCIEAGAEDYLAKPFNPTLLRARIGACLEKKRGRDRESVLFEQLQSNYKKLQEVEKLRDDMRNMIVHDLRTPLTAVIIGVEMLEKYGALNDTQREMITIAAGGGKTLLGMINDLLDVEKMESGTSRAQYRDSPSAAPRGRRIGQVAALAGDGQVALVPEIPADLPALFRRREQLSRTLVNLIANAIKFTPAGTVTIAASDDGETMRFAVRDTGPASPPKRSSGSSKNSASSTPTAKSAPASAWPSASWPSKPTAATSTSRAPRDWEARSRSRFLWWLTWLSARAPQPHREKQQ
jgi:two-component system sensor histidine kinase/response regulator